MSESKRFWVQLVAFLSLGFLWLVYGLAFNDIVFIIFGVAMVFGVISLFLMTRVISDSKIKRYLEAAFAVASLGVIVYGYLVSSSPLLMIVAVLIFALLTLGFILSYLLPKIRGEV
ncbi:MAG: hypothetical protein QXR45_05365 [Candidatus Bathyarchaeia archaeon]